jgi:hypothetical protein
MNNNQETVEQAKAGFLQAKGRVAHALATTPDDRLNWSPSTTSRTPLQVAAHAAGVVKNLHETLNGNTFEGGTTAEADASFREWEKQFTTREQIVNLLEENSAAYLAWLDSLTPERLDADVKLPFNLGSAPLTLAITFQALHLNHHAAQIDYIQTIYGDHDWYVS